LSYFCRPEIDGLQRAKAVGGIIDAPGNCHFQLKVGLEVEFEGLPAAPQMQEQNAFAVSLPPSVYSL